MKKDNSRIKISKIKHLKLILTDYRGEDKYLLEEYNCLYLVKDKLSKWLWRLESPGGYEIENYKKIDQLNVETFFVQNK
jgi:hypothetical protein